MGQFIYHNWNTSAKRLVVGLVVSGIILVAMYILAAYQLIPGHLLCVTVMGLAFLQAAIQLLCFLHLGSEKPPYWNSMLFIFMLAIILIVVLGSIYIMYNLNYHMMM
jgi:cytochrome o ubiquinol oxidase operon protein cyoD